ncbi:membrane dipeptidase [Dactylosporangium sp. McL0621]|uniref:membrane dipeptidase n=1 Tax=Dactylosporangium sp. McL0621 TaxID=3415678 RepID=UPI003CF7C5B7
MDVMDGHNDLPWRLRIRAAAELDLSTDLPRLRRGGVGAQFWSVYVPNDRPEPQAAVLVVEQVELVRRLVARHGSALALATNSTEVRINPDLLRLACPSPQPPSASIGIPASQAAG